MKNAWKFSYSKPFTSTTRFDTYPPSYSPYSDELTKVTKLSSSSPGLMTIITTEFASELARALARNLSYIQSNQYTVI